MCVCVHACPTVCVCLCMCALCSTVFSYIKSYNICTVSPVILSQVTAAKCKVARERSPADPAADDKKFIPTGVRNVFTLVQKFSSSSNLSDLSLSEQEKSPLPGGRGRERFTWDSLGVEDGQPGTQQRRTPERTQSFVDRRVSPSHGIVQRGASMRNPTNYKKTTAVSQHDADKENSTDKENGSEGEGKPTRVMLRRRRPVVNHNVPDEELARILNRRSLYLENYEAELASSSDGCSSAEKSVSKFEKQLAQRKCRNVQSDTDDELQLALRVRRERRTENSDSGVTTNGQTLNSDISPMARTSSAEQDHLSSLTPGSTRHYVAKNPVQTDTRAVSTRQADPAHNSCSSNSVNYPVEKNTVPTADQRHSHDKPLNSGVNKATKTSPSHAVEPTVPGVVKTEPAVSAKSKSSTETKNSPQHLGEQSSSVDSNVTASVKQRVPLNPHSQVKPSSSTVQKVSKESTANPMGPSIPPVLKKEAKLGEDKPSAETILATSMKHKHPVQPPTQGKPSSTTVRKALKDSTSNLVEQSTPTAATKETNVSKLKQATETMTGLQPLGVQSSSVENSVATSVKHTIPLNPHTHQKPPSSTLQKALNESTSKEFAVVPPVQKKETKVSDEKLKQSIETKAISQPLDVQGSSLETTVTTIVKEKVPLNPHAQQKLLSSTVHKVPKEATFHSGEAATPPVPKKETKVPDDKSRPSTDVNTSTQSTIQQSSSVENHPTTNGKHKVPLNPHVQQTKLSSVVQKPSKESSPHSVEAVIPPIPKKETKVSDDKLTTSTETNTRTQPTVLQSTTVESNLMTNVKQKVPLRPPKQDKPLSSTVENASKVTPFHSVEPSVPSVTGKETKVSENRLNLTTETKIIPQPVDVHSSTAQNNLTTSVKHKIPLNPRGHEKRLSSPVQTASEESSSHAVDPNTSTVSKKETKVSDDKLKLTAEAKILPQPLGVQSSSGENDMATSVKHKVPLNPHTHQKPLSSTLQKESVPHPVELSKPPMQKKDTTAGENKSKSTTENAVTTSIKQKPPTQDKPLSSAVQKALKESTFHADDPGTPQVLNQSDDKSPPSTDTKTSHEEPTAPLQSSKGTRMLGLRKTYSMMECDLPPPSRKSQRRHLQRAKTIASPSIDPELAEALNRRRKRTGEKEEEEKANAAGDTRYVI